MSAQPPSAPPSNTYQSILVPQLNFQSQTATSQAQYRMLPNPSSQQYLQPSGGIVNSYTYGSIPPLPPGPPPPPPPPHMIQQQMLITQQQPLALAQQPSALTQQYSMPLPPQPPAPPSFRPLGPIQPPGMVYYGHPHYSH